MLDIFNRREFSLVSLTSSINLQPQTPGRLARHFTKKGIRTTVAAIEEKNNRLSIIQSAARGSQPNLTTKPKRVLRSFTIPHLPHDDQVLAADVQDLRAFGSEDALMGINQLIDEKSENLAADHEATWEWHRAGAIQGIVFDADLSIIHNYFEEFRIPEVVITIDSSQANSFRKGATAITRALDDALGATMHGKIYAYCGDQFWDAFINDPQVTGPFDRWEHSTFETDDPRMSFKLWGIHWEEYRYKLGSRYFIPRDVCRIVVEGRNMFEHLSAPADIMKAVNTIGKPMYMMQDRMPMDKGINLHSQSNPLMLPRRPRSLIKVQII